MAVYRCKMCGGDLSVVEGTSYCTCEFCGTQQTIPTVKDEGLQNLFNRANLLRMKSEFDKAAEIYEKILQRSATEAEAYWGLILCKYGIEYVEDPTTFKRIPTCHRASYDAVTADEDYKNALKYADTVQRGIYEEQAREIDQLQKGILDIVHKEKPYDIFICYKETDENGKRTPDSVIANDIYHQLTAEGFKVFYAAITLEDKLGTEYEPYIFSALNTARVMLAIGTKPEYFNAVWVKNEWSRFLKIMKKDRSRLLIPCYRDMDPYELPEEFAHLQAQDMSKIGFINDIVRGIKKVVIKETVQDKPQAFAAIQPGAAGTTATAQIKRGNLALEDHEWEKADGFFEEALNLDPECAEAYLGKLLARDRKPGFASWIKMQKEKYSNASPEKLEACPEDQDRIRQAVQKYVLHGYLDAETIWQEYAFDLSYSSVLSSRNMQKQKQLSELSADRLLTRAKQYAKGDTKQQIDAGITELTNALDGRITEAREQDEASIARVKAAYAVHMDTADKKAQELHADALNRQEQRYQVAVSIMKAAGDIVTYEEAHGALEAMNGYKDSAEFAAKCQLEIARLREEERKEAERQAAIRRQEAEKKAKKRKKTIALSAGVTAVVFAGILVATKVIIPNNQYNSAVALKEAGNYEEAINVFEAMNGYKDSAEQIEECEIGILENKYKAAMEVKDAGNYEEAITAFKVIDGYKDSAEQIEACEIQLMKDSQAGSTVRFGSYEQDGNASNGQELVEWRVLERQGSQLLLVSEYALNCESYNETSSKVTWEKSTIRAWLNGEFLSIVFSEGEQGYIKTNTVPAHKNPRYYTNPGSATEDRVFLLSIEEVEKYFKTDEDRKCKPTQYAVKQGVNGDNCWWWLRSPGSLSNLAAIVSFNGSVSSSGVGVPSSRGAVRPALWIDLES